MKIKVKFLQPYKSFVGKDEVILELDGGDIKYILTKLSEQYPKFGGAIRGEDGSITDYISIFINDKPLSASDWLETKLADKDEILIFFPISGGKGDAK